MTRRAVGHFACNAISAPFGREAKAWPLRHAGRNRLAGRAAAPCRARCNAARFSVQTDFSRC